LALAAAWLAACLVTLQVLLSASQGVRAPDGPAPERAERVASDQAEPPAMDDPRWRDVPLARPQAGGPAWYRVRFDLAAAPAEFWALYLPYWYGGGQVWLNGVLAAEVPQTSAVLRVRWERPHLLPVPTAALREGSNVLLLRAAVYGPSSGTTVLPRLRIGPQAGLQPLYERRFFVVRTVPVVTVITGIVVGALVLLIWWRRREEVLYGLFGLAALLWALRTTTFVFDNVAPAAYPMLRLLYFASTGGFVIVFALFALALAGWSRPVLTRALLGYWALGPLVYLLGGEQPTARWWVAGLAPVGIGLAAVVFTAAWRQRSISTVSIAVVLALAVMAGLHDQLVATNAPVFLAALPAWTAERYFLLHHAANLLLLVMGLLLALRFVAALTGLEEANRTLEARVRDREREIAASYERIAALQREQATQEERQRIMQELHDGVGAHLVSTLMRAQRGDLTNPAMSDAMRGAIDEMRVAIEALTGEDGDLAVAFGNFRFRWDTRLRDAGLVPRWEVHLPEEGLTLPPHDTLQLLRVAQEALVNVLKHSQAKHVRVRLVREAGQLRLEVADDGRGLPGGRNTPVGAAGADAATAPGGVPVLEGGRGLANMRARAVRLKAQFTVASGGGHAAGTPLPGLHLALVMPLA
jgi:signal transduction histidine kinase